MEELDANFNKIVPISFFYDNLDHAEAISKRIREFYFADRKIDNETREDVVHVSITPQLQIALTDKMLDVHGCLVFGWT